MRVVVTGMGVVSPLGNSVAAFWDGIVASRSGARYLEDDGFEGLSSRVAATAEDVAPAGMDGKELRRHARYTLFAAEAASQAVAASGIDIGRENPWRCGVLMGSGIGGIEVIYENAVKMHTAGPRRVSPLMVPTGISNMASGVVAMRHGFQGPNKAIVTACATGSHCIGDAADCIRLGRADVMLAGSSEATCIPYSLAAFGSMRALSTRNDSPETASRPFDVDRDGFVMGEGAGAFVLESEEHAKARGAEILVEVLALGESCDAHHITAPLEDGAGAATAMRAALDAAQVAPERVDYYNAHGTSTPLNDPAESRALQSVFGEAVPPVSSTKSQIGHLLGGAGSVEAEACFQAMHEGVLPPSINVFEQDPACPVPVVANTPREAKIAIAMSTSLGFGGHNACLLLGRYG